MKVLVALALVLAIGSVSAQRRKLSHKNDVLIGGAQEFVEILPDPSANPRPSNAAAFVEGVEGLGGNRRLLAPRRHRALLGNDSMGLPDVTSRLVMVQRQCPASNTQYASIIHASYGYLADLVVDNGVCFTSAGDGNVETSGSFGTGIVFGGAAQEFGSLKPSWESYGWSLFRPPMPPSDTPLPNGFNITRIQGINLHVIGNIGLGSAVGTNCSLEFLSFGIYNAGPANAYDVGSLIYQAKINLRQAATSPTWSWSSNQTAYIYTDIVDITTTPQGIELIPERNYWIRVKLFSEYTTTKRCFVFWGLSSRVHNAAGVKGRWQERGGSSGYSTSCTGAATSPTAVPIQFQSFYNCWNNGVKTDLGTSALQRRCSTYRTQTIPPLNASDCTTFGGAQFNDYNYALVGLQGESGFGSGKK